MKELLFNNNTIIDVQIVNAFNIVFNVFGYLGGGLLSLCLFPQIIKTIRTKSANDISYLWQILSIVGLVFFELYGLYYLLLPVFVPVTLELLLMIILTCLKCYYDSQNNEEIVIDEKIEHEL